MSGDTPRPYPSRRQLREQGWMTGSIEGLTDTGSINAPEPEAERPQQEPAVPPPSAEQLAHLPVPQTRRERREQERLIATGTIPTVNPLDEAAPEPTASQPNAVEAPAEPVAPRRVATPSPEVAPPPARPNTDEGQWRLLTRRERREMERRGETVPETGWIPIIRDQPDVHKTPEPAGRTDDPAEDLDVVAADERTRAPRSTRGSYTVQAAQFSVAIDVADDDDSSESFEAEATQAQPAPLPPVFQSPPALADAPTAPAQEVGVGTDTAHALILPVAPSTDLAGPVGQSGEVILTGNIDLPRYVSEKALTSENDFGEDFSDFEVGETESFTAPVRATDAVSTRTSQSDQPMIRAPRWGGASIALGASAALLGISAVGLLALALLTDMIDLPF